MTDTPNTTARHLSLEEILSDDIATVLSLDEAYERALRTGTPEEIALARKAYLAAKRSYRRHEQDEFAAGAAWTCGRCGGSGVYLHYGTCFNCGGTGYQPGQPKHRFQADPKNRMKQELARNAERQAEASALELALNELPAPVAAALRASEDTFQRLNGYYNGEGEEMSREETFRHSLYCKLRKYGSLSDAQVAAVERGLERDAQKAADEAALQNAAPLVGGKREVEGVIVSTKTQHGDYGSTLKMLVKQDDGNKVWGTVPRKVEDLAFSSTDDDGNVTEGIELVGQRIRFTAQVERSSDDPHFGFFKRPTKVEVI